MTWEPDALKKVRELSTNCSDFIYGASEFLAKQRGSETVTVGDVEIVLAFIQASMV